MKQIGFNLKAVIFDMDGVLLDTESICKKCWQIEADKRGLKNVDEVYYKCVGQARQDTLSTLTDFFSPQDKNFDAADFYLSSVELFKEVEKTDGIPKMKGVDSCLKSLFSTGIPLAVASSTRRKTVLRQLKEAELFDYFKTFTCGDSVAHSKPDPEIYIKACNSISVEPKNCLAVEDSPNGVRSAFAAGMKVVMIPDLIKPTEEISKMCFSILPSIDLLPSFLAPYC
ncbi:HAD family hydrolase [Treponema pectinovorum]|uniref:HAD family hydrolase n=1 Tax=Treponema pectinovorum TaxID=164 RepID=UPI0011C88149|nr:HAD family phosphatase [Treponema pectinovorum]